MKALAAALALCLAPYAASAKPEVFKVNTKDSVAKWEGKKLVVGGHHGELRLKGGELQLEKGALVGGTVEVDMTTLTNTDVTDKGSNAKLVGHLKNDDFFSVDKHPTSTLKITKVAKEKGKTLVTGDLTIKGISHPVTFPAEVNVAKNGVKAKGTVTVDRTLYDIRYRSTKFFEDLGDKAIHDSFTVSFDLSASK